MTSAQRPQLRGIPLLVSRVGWIVLALLTISVFIASVPLYFRQQTRQLSLAEQVTGQTLSPPLNFRVAYTIAFDCLIVAIFLFTAVTIFWRGSSDRTAILVSTALLTLGVTISPTLNVMHAQSAAWRTATQIVQYLGTSMILLVFYLFPDGDFVPPWTRVLAIIWGGWSLLWTFFPTVTFDPENLPTMLRILLYLVLPNLDFLGDVQQYARFTGFLLTLAGWLGTGIFAQVYRYIRVSTPVQRQQTKWIVFGLTAAAVGYIGYNLLQALVPAFQHVGLASTLFRLIGKPIYALLMILAPLSILISLMSYRLWDIDPIIHRTLVYGGLTGALAIFYTIDIYLLQRLFQALTGQTSDLAIVLSTLAISALFRPLRRRLQAFIDRLFYRERIDFRQAFTNFSREIRTIIELPQLLDILIERTTEMMHITYAAVFLRDDNGQFIRAEARDLPAEITHSTLPLENSVIGRLADGQAISQSSEDVFPLFVPLTAPTTHSKELVGLLALGPRLSGQNYTREDRSMLTSLADQAGTAIYVARLIEDREAEIRRRQEAERRLEIHRNSPIGRAEIFAEELLFEPSQALVNLRNLAKSADQDPNAANLLDNLPRVLDNLGAEPLAQLAEGFNYLIDSERDPEMLPVGLRTIITQLENFPSDGLQVVCRWDPAHLHRDLPHEKTSSEELAHTIETLMVYKLCQASLEAKTIPQITQLLTPFRDPGKEKHLRLFQDLKRIMAELNPVAEALYAYERVDTSRDKLAYLASAIERLRRVDYLARTELNSADRPVMHQITENWLSVVTGAMSDLQTRAQIVCRLLTRHTWQNDVVPLVLSIRNSGRGAALNLRITLAPAPEYTLIEEGAKIDRLAPGDEARVELRVRPHLTGDADEFRARFIIMYTDPRGPDQVENFADVVRLLSTEGEFHFIPNPYVVGTPLEAESPLFFGREDVIRFIQENLTAQHHNNLVLIGQRRTGKTSLLKQLPVRLGDDYLPVYLDGQALGLDPGLPNFFLALATEIAFALEDRGFEIDLPAYDDFVESPTAFFERDFLVRVRKTLGHRHVVVMFDEFEELETAVKRGNLDPSIFGFLRHLIQHSEDLSVIFCGTHRLEELASDYWNVLFNISLYRHIAFLDQPEALRLIREPVAEYEMKYDDLALDKIWRVTAGHPYFLQLLCHSLVNRHNRTERNYVTIADVNAALDEILASGEAHFVYLWAEATPEQRLVLSALSRMMPLTGHATPVHVADYLAERGAGLERQVLSSALHYLTLRDILTADNEADPTGGVVYRWRLGLLGLWVEKYQSMSRVMEEVQRKNI